MGKYINKTTKQPSIGSSFHEKERALLADGAVRVNSSQFIDNMVCLVDNGHFAAAAYLYSEQEYLAFRHDCSGREAKYFRYDNVKEVAD